MKTVLCVEDSAESHKLVENAIGEHFALVWAKTFNEAIKLLESRSFDLALLDSVLPDGDGLQLCSLIHTHDEWRRMPVILLTGRSTVMDKVMAFSIGADDFITKPFEPLELKARVDTLLRKSQRRAEEADIIRCGFFEINKHTQRVTMTIDGAVHELNLTPIEFRMMMLFASNPDAVLSREQILDTCWGPNVFLAPRSVDTSIAKLRAKIGRENDCIESIFGTGYRLKRTGSKSD